ncbi:MAG: 23S rRNA (adenine(2503)-C(2))-methyltransferase RlmN [Breznakibacter sp.]
MEKECLFGKTLPEIGQIVKDAGLPAFTAKQITEWLYKKNVSSIDGMTNLSKLARAYLNEHYRLGKSPHSKVQESADGTKKYLFPTVKGQFIEAAYIPEEDRYTLCVSSQVGCKMGCVFCMTGKQGFQSNLTAAEIVNQVYSLPESDKLTNVVYMGMGEPMDNIREVLKSLEIFTADWGLAWSPRRINVSTIGVIPPMRRFIEESQAHLAVSLHSPFNEERKTLMPIENVYPVEEVVELLLDYDWAHQRRVSFEYIMFKDINDTPNHVKGLTKLLNRLKCRINLIRFHPIPNTPLLGTPDDKMDWFKGELEKKGITTTIRRSRGQDIYAACGLLSTKELLKQQTDTDF